MSGYPHKRRRRPPSLVLAWLPLMILFIGGGTLARVANEDCAACHEDIGAAFAMTAHGVYLVNTTEAAYSCESCHGPGDIHVEENTPESIINPARMDEFGGQETCLDCHTGHQFDDWAFSGHQTGGVNCSSCHKIHVAAGQVTARSAPELCYSCHSDVRAASYMPSHHPIAEGKLDCMDCHNVHGGNVTMALDDSSQELCYGCHADKEGPFVFEHQPVNEDCLICHTAHGSVADNLLKLTEPALCLNCHPMHFHATIESVDGAFSTPQAPERGSFATSDGFKEGMLTKCTQCHAAIHGSDDPSQAISTGGNALTR